MPDNEKNGDSLSSQMARLEIQMTSLSEKVEDIKVNVTQIAKLYEMLAEVEAGTRPLPDGYADVESELPVLAWPDIA